MPPPKSKKFETNFGGNANNFLQIYILILSILNSIVVLSAGAEREVHLFDGKVVAEDELRRLIAGNANNLLVCFGVIGVLRVNYIKHTSVN